MSLKPLETNILNKKENITSINNDYNIGYQTLMKSIDSAKNTSINLSNKKTSISFDINTISREISTSLLLSLVEEYLHPIDKYNRIIISDEIIKWKDQEKITFPSSVINKKIDQFCIENQCGITTKEKKEIFNVISEKYKINTDIKSAQSSIVQMLLNDNEITKKIDSLEICKEDNVQDLKNKYLKSKYLRNKYLKNKNEENQMNRNYLIAEAKGAIYNKMAKAIYNTLFYNDKHHPINFTNLAKDTYDLTEKIIKNKN
ncbi:hypothetical protein ABN196_03005 [Proteus terrae]|uniref:hypothetical protein n=1 Tax=Proteus TaxID=583 RepID=UPI0013E05DA8|nr:MULTISPECIES: hypothetical protein [Proteus]MBG3090062.1 hypothetical protein [Proteus terrae subsp. cibarius]MCM2366186.1 hypothetical protein [Proteus sp. FZP2095]MCO4180624.1 hypothetical protein [Proteus terrae]MCO4189612.1 hypothetical protein [Proteus terrae]QIF98116.1 hypothetical protein GTH25_08655 [Proteus terrae subsp. cibarius]